MTAKKIQIIKFMFQGPWRPLDDITRDMKNVEWNEFSAASDLTRHLEENPDGILLVSLKEKNDVVQLANFMRTNKKLAKSPTLKMNVVNWEKNFNHAIHTLGIRDVLDPSLTPKILKFKLDFMLKALSAQLKHTNPEYQSSTAPKRLKAQAQAAELNKESDIIWTDPVTVESDFWILNKPSDCKKVLTKWLVKLIGPSPHAGQWVVQKSGLWSFEMKPAEKEKLGGGKGQWHFRSDMKPDFIWKEELWLFSGINFELFYLENGKETHRMKYRNRILTMAENSEFAIQKKPAIRLTLNKELVFKKDQDGAAADTVVEDNNGALNDLVGKGKTEHINHANLSGEVTEGADVFEDLKGDVGENFDEDSGNLEGEINKYNEAQLGGHWGLEAEAKIENPELNGEGTSADVIPTHMSNRPQKNSESEEKEKNGKIAFEDLFDDDLTGNVENREKELGGNNGGVSSTDELDKFYKNGTGIGPVEAREKKKSDFAMSEEDNDSAPATGQKKSAALKGAGDTEKIATHYGRAKTPKEEPGPLSEDDLFEDMGFQEESKELEEKLKKNKKKEEELKSRTSQIMGFSNPNKSQSKEKKVAPKLPETKADGKEITESEKLLSEDDLFADSAESEQDEVHEETVNTPVRKKPVLSLAGEETSEGTEESDGDPFEDPEGATGTPENKIPKREIELSEEEAKKTRFLSKEDLEFDKDPKKAALDRAERDELERIEKLTKKLSNVVEEKESYDFDEIFDEDIAKSSVESDHKKEKRKSPEERERENREMAERYLSRDPVEKPEKLGPDAVDREKLNKVPVLAQAVDQISKVESPEELAEKKEKFLKKLADERAKKKLTEAAALPPAPEKVPEVLKADEAPAVAAAVAEPPQEKEKVSAKVPEPDIHVVVTQAQEFRLFDEVKSKVAAAPAQDIAFDFEPKEEVTPAFRLMESVQKSIPKEMQDDLPEFFASGTLFTIEQGSYALRSMLHDFNPRWLVFRAPEAEFGDSPVLKLKVEFEKDGAWQAKYFDASLLSLEEAVTRQHYITLKISKDHQGEFNSMVQLHETQKKVSLRSKRIRV